MTINHDDENVDIEEIIETKDDKGNDTTDWKAIAEKNHGIAKRYKTKFEKTKADDKGGDGADNKDGKGKKGDGDSGKPTETLDRMDKAILRVEKITDAKEVELVENWMKDTGRTLEKVLESKHFQAELKEMRELAASEVATPEGGKRSNQTAKDQVDYWLNAGKLPPVEQVELRRKVVNAKIAKEKNKSQFSDSPII